MQKFENSEQSRGDIVTPTSVMLWLATAIFALSLLAVAAYLSPKASNAVAEAAQQEAGIAIVQTVADPDGALSFAANYAKPEQGGAMGGGVARKGMPDVKPPVQRIVEDGNPYP
jgi:hypothetical protein